jgi:hypothetical protein
MQEAAFRVVGTEIKLLYQSRRGVAGQQITRLEKCGL